MAIEIGSLVVKGSFGQSQRLSDGLSEDDLRDALAQMRREMRADMDRQIEASLQRLKEGMY